MPMKETIAKENETLRIIPADESVFLEGPKNRGYEFIFSIKCGGNLLKHSALCILLARVLRCLVQQGLKKTIVITKRRESLVSVLLK
jgi:hypothetical protein